MKRVISYAIIFVMLSLSLAGCADRNDSPVLPPSRWGTKGTASGQLEIAYGFESAFADADMVAHVRVGDWIGEDTEIYATYYEASVLHSYKGEETGDFVLTQDGCSEVTMDGFPLFTYGNEFLVFCKQSVGVDYPNAYWIIGSYTTVLDAVTTDSGEVYYMDPLGVLGDRTEHLVNYAESDSGEIYYMNHEGLLSEEDGNLINYASLTELKGELTTIAEAKDPLAANLWMCPYIFQASDVEELASELQE